MDYEFYVSKDKELLFETQATSVGRLIARTDKGELVLVIRMDGVKAYQYHFTLDSIPLPEPTSKRLMALLGNRLLETIYGKPVVD